MEKMTPTILANASPLFKASPQSLNRFWPYRRAVTVCTPVRKATPMLSIVQIRTAPSPTAASDLAPKRPTIATSTTFMSTRLRLPRMIGKAKVRTRRKTAGSVGRIIRRSVVIIWRMISSFARRNSPHPGQVPQERLSRRRLLEY